MGYKLYREIRDRAPADWTSGERLVALMIADDANDESRLSWIKVPALTARTGLSERGIRMALQKLGQRGYEFRIPYKEGSDGRMVFAARGHSLDYYVPELPGRRNHSAAFDPEGGTTLPPSDERKAAVFGKKGGTTVPPLSSAPLLKGSSTKNIGLPAGSRLRRERADKIQIVREAVAHYFGEDEELSDGEAAGIWAQYIADRSPRDPVKYLTRIFEDFDYLDGLLSNVNPDDADSACRRCHSGSRPVVADGLCAYCDANSVAQILAREGT